MLLRLRNKELTIDGACKSGLRGNVAVVGLVKIQEMWGLKQFENRNFLGEDFGGEVSISLLTNVSPRASKN